MRRSGALENVVDRLEKKWPEEVAAVSRYARAYWEKAGESAARPLPPDCFREIRTGETSRAREENRVGGARDFDAGPARSGKKKLSPRARAEKIQREKMRALSEFDAMLKKGEWGDHLPEAAGVGGQVGEVALRPFRADSGRRKKMRRRRRSVWKNAAPRPWRAK